MVAVGKKSILFFRTAKETQSLDKVVESKVICAVSARPRSESLRITFVNVRCLRTKNNLVSLFVEDSKPEILYVSEHTFI